MRIRWSEVRIHLVVAHQEKPPDDYDPEAWVLVTATASHHRAARLHREAMESDQNLVVGRYTWTLVGGLRAEGVGGSLDRDRCLELFNRGEQSERLGLVVCRGLCDELHRLLSLNTSRPTKNGGM